MRFEKASLPEIPSLKRQYLKVLAPRPGKGFKCVLLGDALVELWTHYDVGCNRSVPCVGESGCPYCTVGSGRRYKAYIAAFFWDTGELFVCELTEGAARAVKASPIPNGTLRGYVLRLWRKNASKQSPVMADLSPVQIGASLPADFDVIPELERLWTVSMKRDKSASRDMPDVNLATQKRPGGPGTEHVGVIKHDRRSGVQPARNGGGASPGNGIGTMSFGDVEEDGILSALSQESADPVPSEREADLHGLPGNVLRPCVDGTAAPVQQARTPKVKLPKMTEASRGL